MATVCTLASSSSGNCTLVGHKGRYLLIDAGISARRIVTALREVGVDPSQLAGVLITHEHTDHVAGLATLIKHHHLPVWASRGTAHYLYAKVPLAQYAVRPFDAGAAFEVEGWAVQSFSTPHDAADSVGYVLRQEGFSMALSTDLGHVPLHVSEYVAGVNLLVAEANHDEEMLRRGRYPAFLKRRILGHSGHLSNASCGDLVAGAVKGGTTRVILAHLSQENNTPQVAQDTVSAILRGRDIRVGVDLDIQVAPRAAPSRPWTL